MKKNTFDDRGMQRELAMNSTFMLMGLQTNTAFSSKLQDNKYGWRPEVEERLKDGTYFKGIFDWIRLEDLIPLLKS